MQEHVIVWFRRDLRLQDNPALAAAVAAGCPVLPVYIYAPGEEGDWAPGAASEWWLHHALESLDQGLGEHGNRLVIRQGSSREVLLDLAQQYQAREVFWNRCYEPAALERDADVRKALKDADIAARDFNASLLWEPGQVCTQDDTPYRVFTPFWKQARQLPVGEMASPKTSGLARENAEGEEAELEALELLPSIPWDEQFPDAWTPTLEGARQVLDDFASGGVEGYAEQRDCPGVEGTSRLSPYLHSGQLGPRQVWHALHASGAADTNDGFKFLSEIAWREFAYHLLFHFPHTPTQALNDGYRDFPWQADEDLLEAWQRGQTGYPIVDAGMRQLWATGWMHNRVRMIAASLLVKHLLQPWQSGARWFWDTLVDADLASNTLGWQWVAGCGADAAPYFRIFNPMLQGAKFDADGDYVRQWVPELAKLPDQHIHAPWEASDEILGEAGVELGSNYPRPIIDHRAGRERALAALQENKERQAAASDD